MQFWTSDGYEPTFAFARDLSNRSDGLVRSRMRTFLGLSVRGINDEK